MTRAKQHLESTVRFHLDTVREALEHGATRSAAIEFPYCTEWEWTPCSRRPRRRGLSRSRGMILA